MPYVDAYLFSFPSHSVASPPTIQSAEQVSPGTTVTVTWSPPSGGAPVTGYIIHYACNNDSDPQSVAVPSSSTTANITGLNNDGCTYAISVEAQSEQLSGESATELSELNCSNY